MNENRKEDGFQRYVRIGETQLKWIWKLKQVIKDNYCI